MKKIALIILATLSLSISSCDIDEVIYDEALGKDIAENASQESFLAPAYAGLRGCYTPWTYWSLQEYSSDEAMLPTRGTDWYDNGTYQQLHKHEYTPVHSHIINTWNSFVSGIANSMQALSLLEKDSQYHAEAQALLAVYMQHVLDLYGQVPYREIENIDFASKPIILEGEEAVKIIAELYETAIPKLSNDLHNTRMTKDAARGLLARLYLNKAVYVNRFADQPVFKDEDMQKVIALCSDVVKSNKHEISDDYFSMFGVSDDHPEIIFAIRNIESLWNELNALATVGMSRGLFGGVGLRGSDGSCTLPEFLDTWDVTDPRYYKENYPNDGSVTKISPSAYKLNRGFLEGQQYGAERIDLTSNSSEFVIDENGNYNLIPLTNPKDHLPVIHTREVKLLAANQNTGVRVLKWKLDTSTGHRKLSNITVPVLRYADIYLMRAEAYLRAASPNNGEALKDVKAVRNGRKSGFDIDMMNIDVLYKERGFEFYWEFMRRTDQIRFNKWEDSWTDKSNNDKNMRLFPIPEEAVAATDGLDQNPGF